MSQRFQTDPFYSHRAERESAIGGVESQKFDSLVSNASEDAIKERSPGEIAEIQKLIKLALNEKEVNLANQKINELHLLHRVPFLNLFPYCCFCHRRKRRSVKKRRTSIQVKKEMS